MDREKKWCIDQGTRVVCNKADQEYEKFPLTQRFTVVKCGKKVCLKSGKSNHYCTATSTHAVTCHSASALAAQHFAEELLGMAWDKTDTGYFALRGGKHQLYCEDTAKGIWCNKKTLPKSGKFTVNVISLPKEV